jgi:hypothetical protein
MWRRGERSYNGYLGTVPRNASTLSWVWRLEIAWSLDVGI